MYDKFRQIIDKKKITVYQIAKATEIPQSTFSHWKTGRSTPKLDKLQQIALYLGVQLEDLI